METKTEAQKPLDIILNVFFILNPSLTSLFLKLNYNYLPSSCLPFNLMEATQKKKLEISGLSQNLSHYL